MRLEGKTALVTGAGSGFGEGIARRFAEEGARVLVIDIDAGRAASVAAAIEAARQGAARAHAADVADAAQAEAMVRAAVDSFGRLDIVVNNAGVTHRNRPMLEVSEAEFDRIYAVNVKSIFLAAKAAVPVMRAQGGGVILNIASTAGVRPRPGLTWYNGSKGAAITLTRSMAAELAPDRIRVNAINPVMGETGLLEDFMGMPDTPQNRARFIAGIPLGRLSRPEDIANAALFLCSDEAEFVTGVAMEVDGGRCI
ncbi:glucose 1-dehydrogenase [Limibaculum sp. FT325]|uniref:glucose 1-dehydrogenase n=1 Tax=Thermohalobaculum sediminis TaxID=2939436 RepID=UPI0020BD4F65|nr:glucose 1-dehydrogenase [Limibaculum sediminis]MCL5778525.1 glucose 1-dehydrogenase [Limibaculum sediminis]